MVSGLLAMSAGERERVVVVREMADRRLSRKAGAERLGISVRQVKRMLRNWRDAGDAGLVSRQRGRVSPRRLKDEALVRILGLLEGAYRGFGPTLAAEKLGDRDAIKVSRETIRRLQIEHGLWRPRQRRSKKAHPLRERRARFGELIQIDGSPHDWFEGRAPRCSLIVFIDDATGRLTDLRFAPTETTRVYLEALRAHVLAYGRPVALYSDRHGIFRVNAKEAAAGDGRTEFARVAERLGIELICATTPQAKGRVERANQTLQDRLVKEMRLEGVSSMEDAQAFAPQFMAMWNARFAVEPRDPAPAHRPWTQDVNALEDVLARREERVLSKALTFRCGGTLYCVKTTSPGTALRGARVSLLHYLDGTMQVRYKDRTLACTAFHATPVPAAVEDEKTLNARVDALIAQIAASHPKTRSPVSRGCG
jgi:transposase